jgi:small subunit ribosomal protein S16
MSYYRVVVADSQSPRDGRCIAYVGTYAPRENPAKIVIDDAVTLKWLAKGAVPTETVKSLLKKSGTWKKFQESKTASPA